MMDKQLLFVMFVVLLGASGDSVHPKENNHLYDQLKPIMLQCPNTTIEGKAGDTVILPCSTKDKKDISLEEVEWLFEDPTTGEDKSVHVYFQGEDFPHKQSDEFKDRTSLFKDQLSSGNCSLSLLVNTSHSGTYYCSVGGHLCCTVRLKVLPAGENHSSQIHPEVTVSPDKPNNDTDGLTTTQKDVLRVAAALLLLVIIITLAYYYHWLRQQLWSQMKPNNLPVNRGDPVQAQQLTCRLSKKCQQTSNPSECFLPGSAATSESREKTTGPKPK